MKVADGMKRKSEFVLWIFLLPSFMGLLIFYVIPFLMSFYYALIDNMSNKSFVGLRNFISIIGNDVFRRAFFNTWLFILLSVPIGLILSLFIALCIDQLPKGKRMSATILMLPLIIPSGTIVYFWKVLFNSGGLINKILYTFGYDYRDLGQGQWALGVMLLIFLWKNNGYNVILFWAGLMWIPEEYYEMAEMEGASFFQKFRHITFVYLTPTTFVVILMSIANSFKVFKEIYLLYGNYPTSNLYMLQHFMNNNFMNVNMQNLTSASYIMFLILAVIIAILFKLQRHVSITIG